MIPITSPMAQLHSLGQDGKNRVQCNIFGSCELIMQSACRPHITAHTSKKYDFFIFYAITIYVPTTNIHSNAIDMSHMLNKFMCTYDTTVSVYIYLI